MTVEETGLENLFDVFHFCALVSRQKTGKDYARQCSISLRQRFDVFPQRLNVTDVVGFLFEGLPLKLACWYGSDGGRRSGRGDFDD